MTRAHFAVAALILVISASLVACTAAPAGDPGPSASPTSATAQTETVPPIASLAELGDTRWLADDSQGDRTSLKFNVDGTVSYTTSGQSYAYPEDTWSVEGDTLTWQITYGARFGVWTCIGVFDAGSQTIAGTWTSSVGESGTVDLKRPAR